MIRKWWDKQSRGNKVVILTYAITTLSAFIITLLVGTAAMRDLVIPFMFKLAFWGGLLIGVTLLILPVLVTIITDRKDSE